MELQVWIGGMAKWSFDCDEGITRRGGGTCGRSSEELETVEVVWLCLAHSLDRSCCLPVRFTSLSLFSLAFLLDLTMGNSKQ